VLQAGREGLLPSPPHAADGSFASAAVSHRVPGQQPRRDLTDTTHRSVDGGVVAMYAQWHSAQDFLQVGGDPEVRKFRAQISELASFDPHLFDVVFAHHRRAAS
jgi:hypothetical protein